MFFKKLLLLYIPVTWCVLHVLALSAVANGLFKPADQAAFAMSFLLSIAIAIFVPILLEEKEETFRVEQLKKRITSLEEEIKVLKNERDKWQGLYFRQFPEIKMRTIE